MTEQSDGSLIAGRGGAILNLENLLIANSTITGNATDVDGGAIWSRYGALVIEDSTIDNNTAAFRGGALYVRESADTQITNTTISGNTLTSGGSDGGAIQNRASNVTLTSSTITDNTAGDLGGGLAFTFNPATGTFTLESTIVAGNTASSHNDISGAVTANFSLIEDTTGVMITAGANNVTSQPPLLGPLADNGGPTQTHALLPGSQAIDAGNPNLYPPYDQRGEPFSRIADVGGGKRIDIGAYEAQIAPSADFNSDGSVNGFDFLLWQRGFGTPNAQRADGNSDDDMDTDASDLAAWEVSFGQPQPLVSGVSSAQQSAVGGQPVEALPAELIDAAIALATWESDPVESAEPIAERAAIEAVITHSNGPSNNPLPAAQAYDPTATQPEATAADDLQPWLDEHLLDRVFG